jgi:hypothetical protein
MVNAGLYNHPFHPHAFHVRTIAQDGRMFLTTGGADASTEHFGDVVAAGETQDSLFWFKDKDNFCVGSACVAAGLPTKALPVTIPSYRNLTFKGAQTWYSGSPYLGQKGTLPSGTTSYNDCGEFYFPWHSHALNEFVNYEAGFGGLATLLRVDPLVGCTAFAASTKVNAGGGTLKAGTFTNLADTDASTYDVNSTVAPTATGDWYGGFTGITTGSSNLKVTYTGKNSVAARQSLYLWNWRTSAWVPVGSAMTTTGANALNSATLTVASTAAFPASGAIALAGGTATYTGKTATSFTGVSAHAATVAGAVVANAQAVGATDVTINVVVPGSPNATSWSDYIGTGTSAGQSRLRVFSQGTTPAYFSSGNFMKIVYDAP